MKFNFPKATAREKFINLGLAMELYSKIKGIADERNISLLDVIRTFLECSLEEYEQQFGIIIPGKVDEEAFGKQQDKKNAQMREYNKTYVRPEKQPVKALPQDAPYEWSALHKACVNCHSTEKKHLGGGLCSRCYYRVKRGVKHPYDNEHLQKRGRKAELMKDEAEQLRYTEKEMPTKSLNAPVLDDDELVFCQNAACNKGQFTKKNGVSYQKFVFCSEECRDYFNSAGEGEEEYSYTSSTPQYRRN